MTPSAERVLHGGGEMGALMRAFDWTVTPLGPVERWPASLCTAVGILLRTRHPMFMWWGPELIQFYNDAYRQSLGPDRHPSALGQRGRECWDEIWDAIGPQIEAVMERGEATWHEDHLVPITRGTTREDVYWSYSYSPLPDDAGGVGGVLVTVQETTKRVLAQRHALAAEARLRRIYAQAPVPLAVLRGPDHVYEFANPRYQELVGRQELIGRSVREVFPELQGRGIYALLDEVRATGRAHAAHERPITLDRGSAAGPEDLILNWSFEPLFDDAGMLEGIAAVATDVTEQVRARQALETVLEQSPLAIVLVEAPSGRVVFANRRVEAIFGPTEASVRVTAYGDAWHGFRPDGRPLAPEEWPIARAILHGEVVENELVQIVGAKGQRAFITINAAPVRNTQGDIIAGVAMFRDVTTERRIEQQLRDAQRLQSVGTLAGGVAHEVNNQMTAVLGFTYFVQQALGPDHEVAGDLRRVIDAGERAARVTRQLLAFTRRQITQPQVLDLCDHATQLKPTLQQLLGSDKTLEVNCPATAGRILADPGQVEEVLINLVANARDATDTGGRVTIEVRDLAVDEHAPPSDQPWQIARGRYVLLSVSDTGHGMTAETAARIFEPFFTTKEVGRGTGLGLSMVYGIVKQHGGYIEASTETGRGTTLRLYWPAVADTAAERPAAGPAAAPGATPVRPTVMVVEDEAVVRELAARALSDAGYHVVAAENGESAIQRVDREQLRPDLLVTDVIMPYMNGRQLSDALLARHPGVPVLFVSGYTGDDVVLRRLVPERAPFLQKPFSPDRLVSAVSRILGVPAAV